MAKVMSEVLYSRSFSIRTEYPVAFAMKIKEAAERHGKIKIKEDTVYGSTGGKKIITSFEAERNIDNVTSVVFSFSITGEDENLSVFVRGVVKTVLEEKDDIFNEFYTREILKKIMPRAKKLAKAAEKDIEEEMKCL